MSEQHAKSAGDSLKTLALSLKNAWSAIGWSSSQSILSIHSMGPVFSLDEVVDQIKEVANIIQVDKRAYQKEFESFCILVKKRAEEISVNSIGNNPGGFLLGVMQLVEYIHGHFPNIPAQAPPKIDWANLKDEKNLLPKDLARRLRFIDARLNELEPKSLSVKSQINNIEAAHEAAEQLPIDLAELAIRKGELQILLDGAQSVADAINASHTRAEDGRLRIEGAESEVNRRISEAHTAVENMIRRSEQALRGATSVGLANAFEQRRAALTSTANWWTGGLIGALICSLAIGFIRLEGLKDVLNGDKPASVVWANVLLTIVGVGAPIWFAWLSTKQIGTNSRLAEDYAFKASVSQAYEGYRAEAVEIDPALRERLFASALSRIEEAPIRLIDGENHSSPMNELLSRPGIKTALESIPGIADKIVALIPGKAGVAAAVVAPVAATAAVAELVNDTEAGKP